uniref:Uncharacterized protein n=1 Tax=Clytia hemisphaerica TaxID=252671 RepID=A0A7M5VGE9_9CNID
MKSAILQLIFLFSFLTLVILILNYYTIGGSNVSHKASNIINLAFEHKIQYLTSKRSTIKRINVRQRLVNDIGIVIAEEQPDLQEINTLYKDVDIDTLKKQRNNTTSSTTVVNPALILSSIIEHDPTIDENALPLSFKYYDNSRRRLPECSEERPAQRIALSALHHTDDDQILNNIFYRYGDFNNLYFALPKAPTFEYYWPLRFNPSFVDKLLMHQSKPNFIVNSARNSQGKLRGMLSSKTLFLTMLRDPVEHFRDIYEKIDMSKHMKSIHNSDIENFKEFIERPLANIDQILNTTKKFYPQFHLLKNPQLFDLGYEVGDYRTKNDLKEILNDIDEEMSMVIMNEYLDESLVLLQRLLCWQLADMVHLKRRVTNQEKYHLSSNVKAKIRSWNKEDVALYEYFNKTLWRTISENEDPLFWNDVKTLKEMNGKINKECFAEVNDDFVIRDDVIEETKPLCERLALQEKDYVILLKVKQKERIKEEFESLWKSNDVMNGTDGKFLYWSAEENNVSDWLVTERDQNGRQAVMEDGEEEKIDILKL